jgi:signal transduction histidine kinase
MPDLSEKVSSGDRTRAAMVSDFLARWLTDPPVGLSASALVGEAAQVLGAVAAGLWGSLEGNPNVMFAAPGSCQPSWKDHPHVLAELRKGKTVAFHGDRELVEWLAIPLSGLGHCVTWVLVLGKPAGETWSPAQRAEAFLVGQTLFRLLADGLADRDWKDGLAKALVDRDMAQATLICSRLAHDFGNILTGVLGFSELLLMQYPQGSDSHTYINEVHQSAKKGAYWVQMLQLFSRRLPPPQWQPCSLRPVLDEEVQRVSKLWQNRIVVQALVPPGLPHLLLDGDSLKQLLIQLVNNAADSITAPAGVIMIRAQPVQLEENDLLGLLGSPRAGPNLELQIQDSGCGIAAEHRCKLFRELFFSTKPRHRGLGLAVTYGILRTFQGGIRIQPGETHGTVVTVYLPAVGPMLPAETTASPQSATSSQGVRP